MPVILADTEEAAFASEPEPASEAAYSTGCVCETKERRIPFRFPVLSTRVLSL